jgi:hypothetical protein
MTKSDQERRKMKSLLLFAIMLLLSSCGGSSPDPTARPASAPLGAGEFRLTVSGDLTGEVTSTASYLSVPNQGITLLLYAADAPTETTARGVTIVMPANITPGTYPISPYYTVFDTNNQTTAVGATFAEPASDQTGNEDLLLTEVTEGTLTLTSIEPMSGSAVFTIQDEDRTVTINAAFHEIPPLATPAP